MAEKSIAQTGQAGARGARGARVNPCKVCILARHAHTGVGHAGGSEVCVRVAPHRDVLLGRAVDWKATRVVARVALRVARGIHLRLVRMRVT